MGINFFNKNNDADIQFVSRVSGLDKIEECRPKPAKFYIPEWWKDIPFEINGPKTQTIKACPSFPDYFSHGFILPMWEDSLLQYDKQNNKSNVITEGVIPGWEIHPNFQLLDHTTVNMSGKKVDVVFKAVCPWQIITKPGWSVLQLPLFYNFDNKYSILPGIVDTDTWHIINQQVLYYGNGEDVLIKRGDPFALYVPFKRNKYSLDVRSQTEDDMKKLDLAFLKRNTKLSGSSAYRKMQREQKNYL